LSFHGRVRAYFTRIVLPSQSAGLDVLLYWLLTRMLATPVGKEEKF
jgi:hypothetical protein